MKVIASVRARASRSLGQEGTKPAAKGEAMRAQTEYLSDIAYWLQC